MKVRSKAVVVALFLSLLAVASASSEERLVSLTSADGTKLKAISSPRGFRICAVILTQLNGTSELEKTSSRFRAQIS